MEQLEPFFRDLPDRLLNERLEKLHDLLCPGPLPESSLAEPMSWGMIKEMAGEGIEFGAHTVSHLNLRHASMAEAETEMADSKAEIERRAEVRYQQEQAEYEEKQERRTARNHTGKVPAMPESGPRDKDQVNLTDLIRKSGD